MKYKFIKIDQEVEKDVQFGTCELCEYVADLYQNFLIFEDENKKEVKMEVGSWDWGDYDEPYWWSRITETDLIHFADYIKNIEVKDEEDLWRKIDSYFNKLISEREEN